MSGAARNRTPGVAAPSAASVVVLHHAGLAVGAPDPRDRQVLRRVLALAEHTTTTLLIAEPQLGPCAHPELDAAGVAVQEAAGQVREVLLGTSAVAAVATGIELAELVHRARPDLSLVVDVVALASDATFVTADHDPLEQPGLSTLHEHLRARERAVLQHAALVVVGSAAMARAVAAVAPGATVRIVAPAVPVAPPRPMPTPAAIGVVGAFAAARGLPAERVLEACLAAAGDEAGDGDDDGGPAGRVRAVGTDASILRRALAASAAPVAGRDLATVARDLAVAITVRADEPLAAELAGLGVPVVPHDPDDPAAAWRAARALATDPGAWAVAHAAARRDASVHHDPAATSASWLAALRTAVPAAFAEPLPVPFPEEPAGPDRSVRTVAPGSPTWVGRSAAGSLAAQTGVTEQLRAEVQPPPLLRWQHALYTNLDLAPDVAYRRWLAVHHDPVPRAAVVDAMVARLEQPPLVSVVMPVHDTDPAMLRAAVASIRAQRYPHWQLCIVDDGSRSTATRAVLATLAGDARIDVVRRDVPGGIADATNRAIASARGSYVAFCDHDDVLEPDALAWIARAIDLDPRVDIVYTDEDKLDEDGRRVEPFCKPDWSPDLLLSCNYITHLLVVRTSLLRAVGGLRPELDGAQDYDLLLRLTERTDRVVHVPAPLYSWRKSPQSTAADIGAKPHAHVASRRAVDEALVRRGIDGHREAGIDPTWHRVRRRIVTRPEVTVIIPTRDRLDLLAPCIDLLREQVGHEPLEILIVDNESRDPATLAYLDAFDGRVVRYPHRFNYARQMNLAAIEARGEVLLLLNNDARPVGAEWFDSLLEHALRPEIGAVGARLRFPDGRAQHEGVVLNAGGVALNLDSGPYAVLGANIRDVAAVTGACLMVRRTVWDAVSGMDERLRVAYNDVDLCLRIGELGWRNLYTPLAEITHAESSSRGSLHPEVDEAFYQRRWGPPQTCADPFFTTAIELLHPFSPRL